EFWINLRSAMTPVGVESGTHVALRARSREAVDAFHTAALAAGGACDGAPGLRPQHGDGYYAAVYSRSRRQPHRSGDISGKVIRNPGALHPLSGNRRHFFLGLGYGARGGDQLRQYFLYLVCDQQIDREIGADEVELLHVVDQRAQRIPETVDV